MKKLTLLHSNDFHADLFSKVVDGKKSGGLAFLSDYVLSLKKREKNSLYLIAGDAFGGDVNDSAFSGMATFLILNHICPDAFVLGNHELDYGIAQLSMYGQLANFPILCSNIKIYHFDNPFFKQYTVIKRGGLKILVIGIISTSVAKAIELDKTSYEMFYVDDYMLDISNIYKTSDYKKADMVVILSHVGIDEDKQIASKLPNDKFTIIVGGHSHTLLNEPVVVNGIPIVQVGIGTNVIGRMELCYDEHSKKISSYDYHVDLINEDTCKKDKDVEEYLDYIVSITKQKYDSVLCRLSRKVVNEDRNLETDFGCFMADVLNACCLTDLFVYDPGISKTKEFGPTITYRDLVDAFPRINELIRCKITGKQLRQMFAYSLKHYGHSNNDDLFVQQVSNNIKIIYDKNSKELLSLLFKNIEVKDDDILYLGLLNYSLKNSFKKFTIEYKDIVANGEPIIVHPNFVEAMYNFFIDFPYLDINIAKRYIAK